MSKLERTTYIALITLCIVSAALLLERRLKISAPVPRVSAASMVGSFLNAPGINWRASQLNAVLFMNTHCHFCVDSMPFYRQVSAVQQAHRRKISWLVISTEAPEEVAKLLTSERVVVGGVYRVAHSSALRGTPTLLVVDSRGIVRRVFEGTLDPFRQEEFLKILQNDAI